MIMKLYAVLFTLTVLLCASNVRADQTEAREVARINNCIPKKIDVYQQSLGGTGKTVYLVTCTLPKPVGDEKDAKLPDSLLISCDQSLCEMIRPMTQEKK